MLLLGCLYCVCSYWLDKVCLLRCSARPPAYNKEIIMSFISKLKYAAIFHCLMATWSFGNPAVAPSGWSFLRGLMQGMTGITSERYETIKQGFFFGEDQEREQLAQDYLRTRILDCVRVAPAPVFIVLFALMFYTFVLAVRLLLSPFWQFYQLTRKVKTWINNVSAAAEGLAEATVQPLRGSLKTVAIAIRAEVALMHPSSAHQDYVSVKPDMETRGFITSYRMKDNPAYKAAYKALHFSKVDQAIATQPEAGTAAIVVFHQNLKSIVEGAPDAVAEDAKDSATDAAVAGARTVKKESSPEMLPDEETLEVPRKKKKKKRKTDRLEEEGPAQDSGEASREVAPAKVGKSRPSGDTE